MVSNSSRISRRRKRSSSSPDLRHVIAYRKILKLKHVLVAIIGDDETGRNTMVRRFLNMSSGPFQQPENRKYTSRSMLVDLSKRPNICKNRIIHLCVSIINLQRLDFSTMHLTLSELKSSAVVFDVANTKSFYMAIYCMVKITTFLGDRAPMFNLIGNKTDLPLRQVTTERGEGVAETCKASHYYECSALMNDEMDIVFDDILSMALRSRSL